MDCIYSIKKIIFKNKIMKNILKISGLVLSLTILFGFTANKVSISKVETSLITFSDNDLMKPMNDMMDRMNKMKMTGDFDYDFATMMIEHHQGAIDMSQILLKSGKNKKLKDMTQKGISMQKESQKEVRAFISKHKMESSKNNSDHNEIMEAMEKMMKEMKGMKMSRDMDKDFAMMMTMHHKSGIDMSNSELSHGKAAELKQMAQKMIDAQKKEIKELQDWL